MIRCWIALLTSALCMRSFATSSSSSQETFYCSLRNLMENGRLFLTSCSSQTYSTVSPQTVKNVYGFFYQTSNCYYVERVTESNYHLRKSDDLVKESRCLYFTRLNISVLENYAIDSLPNVLELSFRYNRIREIKPFAFANNSQLTLLDLDSNELSTLAPNLFAFLTNLHTLQLSNNLLYEINGTLFKSLGRLRVLYIANNRVRGTLRDKPFQFLTYLNDLSLRNNFISGCFPTTFEGLFHLRTLNLRHNLLQVVNSGCFVHLLNLRQLDLGENFMLQLASTRQFPSTVLLNTLKLDATPLLEFSRAWLDDVPLECAIHVSQFVYNCSRDNTLHPLHQYRRIYVPSFPHDSSSNFTVCVFQPFSTPSASERWTSTEIAALLAVLIAVSGTVILSFCHLKRRRQKFQLHHSIHVSRSELSDARLDCKISSVTLSNINLHRE